MKTRFVSVALGMLILVAPALAHSFPVPGGGTQSYSAPGGGGTGNSEGGTAAGGNGNGGDAYGGPVGGGGAPGSVPTSERPRPQTTSGASAGLVGARSVAKGKGGSEPWLDRIRVPWVPVFLPAIAVLDGYAVRVGTVADGVRLSYAEGGWSRDTRPVMVFAYDATNADHKRILATLDTDGRVKTAAHFFNCFRVDVGAFGDKRLVRDARLSVFTSDGTLFGEVTGRRKMNGVYELMESAWTKQTASDLVNRVAKMDGLLKTRAHCEHFIPLCEAGIVCPDCGHERLDIKERIAELKARAEACDRAMDQLRVVARN